MFVQDVSQSEGEFCHQSVGDPTGMLALLNKIQAGARFYQCDLTLPDVHAVLNQTGASTGEISLGQQLHGLSPPHRENMRSVQLSEDWQTERQPGRQTDGRLSAQIDGDLDRQTAKQLDGQTAAPKVTLIQSRSPANEETGGNKKSEVVNETPNHGVVPGPSILKKSQELGQYDLFSIFIIRSDMWIYL